MDVYTDPPLAQLSPSQEQLSRAAALRRFNRLYVYTPLAVGALIYLALLGWLAWGMVSSNCFSSKETGSACALASGLADTVFIVMALPWALVCTALPLLFFAGILQSRKQGHAPLRRLQRLFWRLDDLLHKIDRKANDLAARSAHYVVAGSAFFTRIQTTVARLRQRRR